MSPATAPVSAPAPAPVPVPAVAGHPDGVSVLGTVSAFAQALDAARRAGRTVGLVPTMGALHAGHRSLIERAAAECDVVAVTVFVNPLQFGDPDDIAHYPRTLDADVELAGAAGARFVFAPTVEEMYPDAPAPVLTAVSVSGLAGRWEGASRPGHFDGVATVVAKLFAMAGPCRAYFGEKDFQQLAVVRTMARDLSFPVEVVGCPTVRDDRGLALSSRNVRLSAEERDAALVLVRSLRAGAAMIRQGEYRPSMVEARMAHVVADEPAVDLDYAVLVYADDLSRAMSVNGERPLRLLIAARVGPVRLIDNLDPADPGPSTGPGASTAAAGPEPTGPEPADGPDPVVVPDPVAARRSGVGDTPINPARPAVLTQPLATKGAP